MGLVYLSILVHASIYDFYFIFIYVNQLNIFYRFFDFEILMKNICQIKSLIAKINVFWERNPPRLASGLKKSVENPETRLWIFLIWELSSVLPGMEADSINSLDLEA
jgi:hypothetical protein